MTAQSRTESMWQSVATATTRKGVIVMDTSTYGLDISKRVFQMNWAESDTGEIVNRQFTRQQLIEFLGQRIAGRVALEACGSAH
ncbi:hypothetical protein AXG89_28205 (plasmid) [Burkholderia sp. PAMC 26561]|nr:hypothetical protein AXG89_24485 [Burkholderia sp. PAMC 26561]AME27756.2 hypothetical protein AXG89_28205 [Burkholderia sp. PAMC 26561]